MLRLLPRELRRRWRRRLLDPLLTCLGVLAVEFWWRTCRIEIVGEPRLAALIAAHGAVVPVCWHQHLLLTARWAVARRTPGMNPGFLISPSDDGNAPSWVAAVYRAKVIRGSSTRTGPQAMRSMYRQVKDDQLSPVITPDGPKGPRFEFKGGAIALAQLCAVPLVPVAFAARTAKVMRTWDKFVLPRPFTKVVLLIGEPVMPPRRLTEAQTLALQQEMAQHLHATYRQADAILQDRHLNH